MKFFNDIPGDEIVYILKCRTCEREYANDAQVNHEKNPSGYTVQTCPVCGGIVDPSKAN